MAARKKPSSGGKPDKLMRDAIMLALNRNAKGTKTKKLTLIADKLVDLAVEGDLLAIKEVNDRSDGKAAQPLEHSGTALEGLLERLASRRAGRSDPD